MSLLVGDGIENPHNALVLQNTSELFGWQCGFRDRRGLGAAWKAAGFSGELPYASLAELRDSAEPLLVLENGDRAVDIYDGRIPRTRSETGTLTLVVGNERRGVARDVVAIADQILSIPMVSRSVNCLNVAAAAGVALYYLTRRSGAKRITRNDPNRHRPEVLVLGGGDHFELGSTIRSAAAFGWRRLFLEDRASVWFGCDRITRSEGRAAARRGKNAIRLVPAAIDTAYAFDEAVVVSRHADPAAEPLHRIHLARGSRQLIVLADEAAVDLAREGTRRFAARTRWATFDLEGDPGHYHFRVAASIVLAEVARQMGVRKPRTRRGKRPPIYDQALRLLGESRGEVVYLEDLVDSF